MRTIIQQNWSNVAWACLLVFIVQMPRPTMRAAVSACACPAQTSSHSGAPARRLDRCGADSGGHLALFAGRNAVVDIATLAMIYVMLGLGLNVVGFAGLLDLGFVGFYAVGAYTYALLFHWAAGRFGRRCPGRCRVGAVRLCARLSGTAPAR